MVPSWFFQVLQPHPAFYAAAAAARKPNCLVLLSAPATYRSAPLRPRPSALSIGHRPGILRLVLFANFSPSVALHTFFGILTSPLFLLILFLLCSVLLVRCIAVSQIFLVFHRPSHLRHRPSLSCLFRPLCCFTLFYWFTGLLFCFLLLFSH